MSALLKTMAARLSFASRLGAAPVVMAAPAARPASPRSMVTRAQVNQKDLIAEVMQKALLTNTQADAAIKAVFGTIAVKVAEGQRVAVAGFGIFEQRTRSARKGRNPKTGEALDIPEKKVPAFSAGKAFKDIVANGP